MGFGRLSTAGWCMRAGNTPDGIAGRSVYAQEDRQACIGRSDFLAPTSSSACSGTQMLLDGPPTWSSKMADKPVGDGRSPIRRPGKSCRDEARKGRGPRNAMILHRAASDFPNQVKQNVFVLSVLSSRGALDVGGDRDQRKKIEKRPPVDAIAQIGARSTVGRGRARGFDSGRSARIRSPGSFDP